ncbi:MAG: DUF2973 domain-containing protein [Cyanobacteriota bacterium]|nr:DUF2973 domain-containing protein [Cyanobacteriota bacterium]
MLSDLPAGALPTLPAALISQIFPILYGGCFLVLLWQAFRVMARGFQAVEIPSSQAPAQTASTDRTGRLTIHPELLDAQGQLTQEDLLTVRFGNESPPEA